MSSSPVEEDNGMNLGMCIGIGTQQHVHMQQKDQQLSSNDPADIQVNPVTITTSNINDNERVFCNIQDHVYLQQKISELDRIINIQRKQIGNLESLIENMKDKVNIFMNEDQIRFMQKKDSERIISME